MFFTSFLVAPFYHVTFFQVVASWARLYFWISVYFVVVAHHWFSVSECFWISFLCHVVYLSFLSLSLYTYIIHLLCISSTLFSHFVKIIFHKVCEFFHKPRTSKKRQNTLVNFFTSVGKGQKYLVNFFTKFAHLKKR